MERFKTQSNARLNALTLAGTRHFAIFHGTRGRGFIPPPSRFAPDWGRGLIKKPARFLSRDEAVDTRV